MNRSLLVARGLSVLAVPRQVFTMSYDYEAELAAWRERMAAKPCARYVRLADGFVRRPTRQPPGFARVEYDTDAAMPRYEDFSQEAA